MGTGDEDFRSVDSLLEEIRELRAKEDYYKNILESANKGVWVINDNQTTVYINYRMAEMMGYTIEEVMGENMLKYVHEDDTDDFIARLSQCRAGCDMQFDLKLRHKDGRELWTIAGIRQLFSKEGNRIGITGTFADITERKLMEIALNETKEDLVKAQHLGRMGSWVRNLKSNRIEYSDEISNILGIPRGGIFNTEIFKMIHPDDKAKFSRFAKSAIERIGSDTIDFRVIRPDGRLVYCHVEGRVIPDKQGRAVKTVGILQDVTERITTEMALRDATAQAEFLIDLISHDIGNMNQAIQGYLELAIEMYPVAGAGKELIVRPMEIIKKGSRLIKDVRLIRQLRNNMIETKMVDAGALLAGITAKYDQDIKINYSPVEECHVLANELLSDAFSGIIENFIEYSDPKALTIGFCRTDDKKLCEFTFEDGGSGIPDKLKRTLMVDFWEQKNIPVRRVSGLQFVRIIIEAFQGKAWVEDRVHGDYKKGVRLVIMLPMVEQ